MTLISPIGDTIIDVPQGAQGVTLEAVVEAPQRPTGATLTVDLKWWFSIKPSVQNTTPEITDLGGNRYKVAFSFWPPYEWRPLPQVHSAERWIEVTGPSGTVKTGKLQFRTV